MRLLLSLPIRHSLGGFVLAVACSFASGAEAVAPSCAAPTYAAPYAGPVNHAHSAPSFQWGWFGADPYYPQVHWRRDYNGELMRWSVKRRY